MDRGGKFGHSHGRPTGTAETRPAGRKGMATGGLGRTCLKEAQVDWLGCVAAKQRSGDHRSRIHDSMGIKRCLDRAHGRQLCRIGIALQLP